MKVFIGVIITVVTLGAIYSGKLQFKPNGYHYSVLKAMEHERLRGR